MLSKGTIIILLLNFLLLLDFFLILKKLMRFNHSTYLEKYNNFSNKGKINVLQGP